MGSSKNITRITGVFVNPVYDVTHYGAVGDGVTDDRGAILACCNAAIANMPSEVYFPPGDYAISNGIDIKPAQGSMGLVISGAGANVTRIKFSGASSLSNYYAFKITPSVIPSPKDTLSEYINNVIVEGIGFYDDDPFTHQTRGADLATGTAVGSSGSATVMTDTTASFTPSAFVGQHLANTTDGSVGTITANDATTITVSSMFGGTDNQWDANDGYEVSQVSPTNTVEESHAITMQYIKEGHIVDCGADNIGDEAFNFTFVVGGSINGNKTVNCPSISAGGGAIAVQHGSQDIDISANRLYGSNTLGTISGVPGGAGIDLEAIDAFPVVGVSISRNKIRDFGESGVVCVASAAAISNVSMDANNIRNTLWGFSKKGSQDLSNFEIIGNTFDSMVDVGTDDGYGIYFPGGVAETFDCVIAENVFKSCATGGMRLTITNAFLSNNNMKSCPRGIFIFDGVNINIASGSFDSCGGNLQEEIEDVSTTSTTKAANIIIENSATTNSSIKGVAYVSNVEIRNSNSGTQQQVKIFDALNVIGCTVDGGIRVKSGATGGVIANNTLAWDDTGPANSGVAIELASGNSNYSITGNSIDLSGSTNNQYCISLLAGANNNIVAGNNLQSLTAGAANALNDAGTGNIADTTTGNKTT